MVTAPAKEKNYTFLFNQKQELSGCEKENKLNGALLADSNSVNGTVVRNSEPPEARKPKRKWRLYVFKGNEELPILYIHRQYSYLLGRDPKVADVPLDHPSCSKQHSDLQFRLVPFTRDEGTASRRVQLYVMQLGSSNGASKIYSAFGVLYVSFMSWQLLPQFNFFLHISF